MFDLKSEVVLISKVGLNEIVKRKKTNTYIVVLAEEIVENEQCVLGQECLDLETAVEFANKLNVQRPVICKKEEELF